MLLYLNLQNSPAMVSLKFSIIASATFIQSINLSEAPNGTGTGDDINKILRTFASFKIPKNKLIAREAHATRIERNVRSAYVACVYKHVQVLRTIIWYDPFSTETVEADEKLMECATQVSKMVARDESLLPLDISELSRHVSTFIQGGDRITRSDPEHLIKLTDKSILRLEKRKHYDPELLAMKVLRLHLTLIKSLVGGKFWPKYELFERNTEQLDEKAESSTPSKTRRKSGSSMKQEMEIAPSIILAKKTAFKLQISKIMTTSLTTLSDVLLNFLQILDSFASSFFSTKEKSEVPNKCFRLMIATNEYLGKLDGVKEMLEIQLSNKELQHYLERQLDSGVDWNERLGEMKNVVSDFLSYYDRDLKDIPFTIFDASMEYGNKHTQNRL